MTGLEPFIAAHGTTIGTTAAKASASPIKNYTAALKRRRSFRRILLRALQSDPKLVPDADVLAVRIWDVAYRQASPSNKAMKKLKSVAGTTNPQDRLEVLPSANADEALRNWARAAIVETRGAASESDVDAVSRLFWRQIALSANAFNDRDGDEARRIRDSIGVQEKSTNAIWLKNLGITAIAAGGAVATDAILFTNDRVIDAGGRPWVVAAEVVAGFGLFLVNRRPSADAEAEAVGSPAQYVAYRLASAWVYDVAALLVTTEDGSSAAQLGQLMGIPPSRTTDFDRRTSDDPHQPLLETLRSRVRPAAVESGDDRLVAGLLMLEDHILRWQSQARSFRPDDLARDLGQAWIVFGNVPHQLPAQKNPLSITPGPLEIIHADKE